MTFIKGKHSVYEALIANAKIHYITISKESEQSAKHILTLAQQKQINVSILSKRDFQQRFKSSENQHIIAKMAPIKTISLKDFLFQNNTEPILICDHLEDPYNFGAIMRTCEGFGVKNILFSKNRQAQLNDGIIKASSGAVYYLNLIEVANIGNAVSELKKNNYWIYGADSNKGKPLDTVSTEYPFALIVGNEHKGISKRLSSLIDFNITIPMKGKIKSFNVSVATAITLYQLIQ
jgi:23S rRNA (guanosine2251-2'-O)-methyltransferase